MTLDKVVFAEC
jgi:hypothetical protein